MNGIYVLVSEAEPNGFTALAQWLTRFLSNRNVSLTSKPYKLGPETFRLMIAPESVMQLPLEAGRDDISDRDYHDNEEPSVDDMIIQSNKLKKGKQNIIEKEKTIKRKRVQWDDQNTRESHDHNTRKSKRVKIAKHRSDDFVYFD
jgi:transcriptional/translational regulatory protein YebC/TACO1